MSIRVSRFISNHMVIQRGKPIHIWGWADSGEKITVKLADIVGEAACNTNGRFDIYMESLPAGGPYELTIQSNTDKVVIEDVHMGDVYQLVGQSNIEFPMTRVRDTYPEEFTDCCNPMIRTFKIVENRRFGNSLEEPLTGEWIDVNAESIPTYSAIGYFMAKKLNSMNNVAIGLINTSLGGSRIESWMSEEMLDGCTKALEEAAYYSDPNVVRAALDNNDKITSEWYACVEESDPGCLDEWKNYSEFEKEWTPISIPTFFKDIPDLKGYIGTVWLSRYVDVDKSMLGKDATIWLGTMTDSDIVYVNGIEVGRTTYCYPPRRYRIPQGVLKEGRNIITIRLGIEKGQGRITDGKVLAIITGNVKRDTDGFVESVSGYDDCIDISGKWFYKKGACVERIEDVNFVSYKATALYNGMLAPCANYPIDGFVWYQGESNVGEYIDYKNLFERLVSGIRKNWKDENLNVYCINLPEFDGYLYEPSGFGERPKVNALEMFQNMMEECAEMHNVTLINAQGYGEINDLHPQRKKPLGDMLAEAILKNQNN